MKGAFVEGDCVGGKFGNSIDVGQIEEEVGDGRVRWVDKLEAFAELVNEGPGDLPKFIRGLKRGRGGWERSVTEIESENGIGLEPVWVFGKGDFGIENLDVEPFGSFV